MKHKSRQQWWKPGVHKYTEQEKKIVFSPATLEERNALEILPLDLKTGLILKEILEIKREYP